MRHVFLSLLVACVGLTTNVTAQNSTSIHGNDLFLHETIANFNLENLTPVLDKLSLPYFKGDKQKGPEYLVVLQKSTGLKFVMMPMACTGTPKATCKALNIIALFSNSPPQQAVNAFNYRYNFLSAGLDPSGAPFLSRYEIAPYGMPVGNLVTSIMLFSHTANKFSTAMKGATKTVRTDSYSNDLSAQYLNLQTLLKSKFGESFEIDHTSPDHTLNFEATPSFISMLLRSKNTTKAKMVNDIASE